MTFQVRNASNAARNMPYGTPTKCGEADEIIVLAEDDDAVTPQSQALMDFTAWRRRFESASFEEADPNDHAAR